MARAERHGFRQKDRGNSAIIIPDAIYKDRADLYVGPTLFAFLDRHFSINQHAEKFIARDASFLFCHFTK
jgi:hypothetical protein